MKSLKILRLLLQDASYSSHETERDWVTIQSRFEHEGLSFLTITLPAFTSWLEQSLEAKHALPTIFSTFHRKNGRRGGSLPAFLLGLTERVFDIESGDLRNNADPSAVYFIRQICSFFKKVKLQCSQERRKAAVKKFLETDSSLPKRCSFNSVTRSVANAVILSLNYSIDMIDDPSFPKHGPGATVERLWGNQKYKVRDYYARWIGIITPEELYGMSVAEVGYEPIRMISPRDEQPCRLSLVPKTLKTPRTIAVEPVAMQYAQQLVSSRLIASMGQSYLTKHIRFNDQSVNNRLAKEGSHGKGLSTIDLSEASDRISVALVREIVRVNSVLRRQLMAVRSTRVSIRGGKEENLRDLDFGSSPIFRLRKFSTSGSAVTFPVETLVFFTLALSAIVEATGPHRNLMAAIHRYATDVSVFGDDIVVPDAYCNAVCDHLESFGLKVNRGKTFSKGSFRESCGGDYYLGHDVTPKYLRHLVPRSSTDANALASVVSTSNQLFLSGCWHAANGLREMADAIFRFPLVKKTSPGLGWWTYQNAYEFSHRRDAYGNYVVRTMVLRSRPRRNPLDGEDALLKALISRGVQDDPRHLLESVPQYSAVARRRMVTPY